VRVGGSALGSDRYLDPVHPDNLHNGGASRTVSAGLHTRGLTRDSVRIGAGTGRSHYDVPNAEEQDEAGQDQRQRLSQSFLDLSWQRAWSDVTVTQVAAYHRRSGSALEGSDFDTPLSATADRSLTRSGGMAVLTHQRGAHLLKAGTELQRLSLDEAFGFVVTDDEEGAEAGLSAAALAHGPDHPFAFAGRASPDLWSVFVQDSWQAGARLAIAAGVRFDRSTMLLERRQWSPRAGVSYRAGSTILRGSVSRFFQPPQPEHLLLSSSAEAHALSPFALESGGGGANVEPERQWAVEAGVAHSFARWHVNAAYWRRDVREVSDPNVFFGTTSVFPNSVARGHAHGADLRIEVPRRRGWSGYLSATVGRAVQTGPVTGGLFLEDEVASLGPGVEFVPDHDQRVALASGVTWEHPRSGVVLSLAARYESGTPIQRDEDDVAELAERPGADLVDFERGRVRPRTLVSLIATIPLVDADGLRVALRGAVLNLFDRRYAYNFGNPFSGTHFGAPRTASVSLQVDLR
jgi:outer membrane receptor for ferrienterochelin and colicin